MEMRDTSDAIFAMLLFPSDIVSSFTMLLILGISFLCALVVLNLQVKIHFAIMLEFTHIRQKQLKSAMLKLFDPSNVTYEKFRVVLEKSFLTISVSEKISAVSTRRKLDMLGSFPREFWLGSEIIFRAAFKFKITIVYIFTKCLSM